MAKDIKKNTGKVESDYPDRDNDLAYNESEESYELDVDDGDPDYDHPADYDTLSEGAVDDDSTYDNSNPFVGNEYADKEEQEDLDLEEAGMHIEDADKEKVSKLDKLLAQDEEDLRDDLDEEGYPRNDE